MPPPLDARLQPARALDALRRENGGPDIEARHQALDTLFDALSREEIRGLRTRINAIDFHYDIFVNLPTELLLNVAQHFELEDFVIARQVSTGWRDRCHNADFAMGVMKTHFRTAWESTDFNDPTMKEKLQAWFPRALQKRVRRRQRRPVSMAAYHMFQKGVALYRTFVISEPHPEVKYTDGRMAFLYPSEVIVINLKAGYNAQPTVYAERNRLGKPRGHWTLSKHFLVRELPKNYWIAWSLDNEDQHVIQMPNSAKYIYGRNNQLGIMTDHSEILIWTFGVSLKAIGSLEISKSVESPWKLGAFTLHPTEEEHFFVFYHCKPAGMSVQEFTNGKYLRTHVKYFSANTTIASRLGSPIVREVDRDGLCIFEWGYLGILDEQEQSLIQIGTFNMYTCEFGTMMDPFFKPPVTMGRNRRGSSHKCLQTLAPEDPFEILGGSLRDDDFEVASGFFGYFVSCYDEEVTLPKGEMIPGATEIYRSP